MRSTAATDAARVFQPMMAAGRGLGWKLEGSGVNSGKGEKKKKKSFPPSIKK